MTTNNENDSRQNLWASNIAKSITSEGDSALLPPGGGELPYETDGDARRKFWI